MTKRQTLPWVKSDSEVYLTGDIQDDPVTLKIKGDNAFLVDAKDGALVGMKKTTYLGEITNPDWKDETHTIVVGAGTLNDGDQLLFDVSLTDRVWVAWRHGDPFSDTEQAFDPFVAVAKFILADGSYIELKDQLKGAEEC